jgi:23S rRNA (uracil1939-C5)-methyltransferase
MIARHEGEIILVAGAIPGERVRVRVTRAEKRLAFADTLEVLEASADRRLPFADPACGGCLYSHVTYERQLRLKADVLRDTFARLGRIAVPETLSVAASPERGYRMRARFHVRDGRSGFYREGTHQLCDARSTGQVSDQAIEAVETVIASLGAQGVIVASVELTENIAADARALHLELKTAGVPATVLERAVAAGGLTGCTARADENVAYSAGDPIVSDPIDVLTGSDTGGGLLRRHPEAFFQANRFLLPVLVRAVMDVVPPASVLELYAGVGLFSVSLAASGRDGITAVEGDPVSGRDLLRNAAPYYERLRVSRNSVEAFLAAGGRPVPDTVIVDPPRTGMSKQAIASIGSLGASRIVYVSCDPATMARDARRLLDAGYTLSSLSAFDLFPNTPHVEALGVFDR